MKGSFWKIINNAGILRDKSLAKISEQVILDDFHAFIRCLVKYGLLFRTRI